MAAQVVDAEQLLRTGKKHLKPAAADKEDNLEYDVGNLCAFDPTAIDVHELRSNKEETLLASARDNVQLLVNRLFELPTEQAEHGRMAVLPEPTTILPREKPIPKPKPLTKWEKFAKARGITKRKRDRMEWDEQRREWRPRYGYKRVNDDVDVPIIEAKPGEADDFDPFAERAAKRKERAGKNKQQQIDNVLRAAKEKGADIPSVLGIKNPTGAPVVRAQKERKRGVLNAALKVAQSSTASMGVHDTLRTGESRPKKRVRSGISEHDTRSERDHALNVLDKVLGGEDAFHAERAAKVARLQDEAARGSTSKRKGGNKGSHSAAGKGRSRGKGKGKGKGKSA